MVGMRPNTNGRSTGCQSSTALTLLHLRDTIRALFEAQLADLCRSSSAEQQFCEKTHAAGCSPQGKKQGSSHCSQNSHQECQKRFRRGRGIRISFCRASLGSCGSQGPYTQERRCEKQATPWKGCSLKELKQLLERCEFRSAALTVPLGRQVHRSTLPAFERLRNPFFRLGGAVRKRSYSVSTYARSGFRCSLRLRCA